MARVLRLERSVAQRRSRGAGNWLHGCHELASAIGGGADLDSQHASVDLDEGLFVLCDSLAAAARPWSHHQHQRH